MVVLGVEHITIDSERERGCNTKTSSTASDVNISNLSSYISGIICFNIHLLIPFGISPKVHYSNHYCIFIWNTMDLANPSF